MACRGLGLKKRGCNLGRRSAKCLLKNPEFEVVANWEADRYSQTSDIHMT
jgi:hypothetical protein